MSQSIDYSSIVNAVLADRQICEQLGADLAEKLRKMGLPVDRMFISSNRKSHFSAEVFFRSDRDIKRHENDVDKIIRPMLREYLESAFPSDAGKNVVINIKSYEEIMRFYNGSYDKYLIEN